jgi:hypothetical protein
VPPAEISDWAHEPGRTKQKWVRNVATGCLGLGLGLLAFSLDPSGLCLSKLGSSQPCRLGHKGLALKPLFLRLTLVLGDQQSFSLLTLGKRTDQTSHPATHTAVSSRLMKVKGPLHSVWQHPPTLERVIFPTFATTGNQANIIWVYKQL